MDNEQRMEKMKDVLDHLSDDGIATRYNYWYSPNALEIGLHTPTDLEKAHTLFDSSENTLGYDSVVCLVDDMKVLILF